MEIEEFLRLVARELCACGHDRVEHDPPSILVSGEVMGPCRKCSCAGVVEPPVPGTRR